MAAIFRKEIKNYFNSMTGYVFLFFFVIVTALYFYNNNIRYMSGDYTYTLSGASIMFLIVIPVLTMRLFSEEAVQKTDQLLYTTPLSISAIVTGKFLAAFCLFLTGMAITGIFPVMLSQFGDLPVSQIFSAFLGFILVGMSFISIGLFISVLTNNQVIAAVTTFAVLFFFFVVDSIVGAMPSDRTTSLMFAGVLCALVAYMLYDSTKNVVAGGGVLLFFAAAIFALFQINPTIFDGLIIKCVSWLSLMARFSSFYLGVLNLSDIIYYFTFTVAFLFLTVTVIEKRRWR